MPTILTMTRTILVGSLVLLSSCEFASGFRYSNTAREFFDKSAEEQEEQFNTYSLEDAYEIYMYGTQVKYHPSGDWLAEPFSLRGDEAVPFLMEKLVETRDDGKNMYIIIIFYQMNWRKTYDVVGDRELMALMESTVNGMKDPYYKDASRWNLMKITASGLPVNKEVPFLKERLGAVRDDRTIRGIIGMFSKMNREKSYDVAADDELMALMESAANGLTDPSYMHFARRDLTEITVSGLAANEAMAFLKVRLDEAHTDWWISEIIEMISELSQEKSYNVAADDELLAVMQSAVNRVKSDFQRQYTKNILMELSASP